jgi:hypothetical protein
MACINHTLSLQQLFFIFSIFVRPMLRGQCRAAFRPGKLLEIGSRKRDLCTDNEQIRNPVSACGAVLG